MKCSGRDLMAYVLTMVLSIGILVWTLQLWHANLAVPFGAQRDDDAFYGMVAKSLIDNPWYLHNAFLSAPEGLDLEDFPITDTAHLALLKLIALWTRNYALALNIFFLLTFPLAAATSLFAFRTLNLSYGVAVACSLLFTFLPYHFFRGEMHLLLSAYYFVPLMAVLIFWMGLDVTGPVVMRGDTYTPIPNYARWPAKLICVLVASAGTYYAVFGGFLLLVAAGFRASRERTFRPLVFAVALVGLLAVVTIVSLVPTIVYGARHGTNFGLIAHSPGQAEHYGLKIPTLILPVSGHRIRALASLKAYYNSQTLAVNENDWATLGIFATIGFLMLLGWPVYRRPPATPTAQLLDLLSTLNICALLLSLTGGFAILVARFLPEIRSYNRMSVYVAFFSLAALGVCLDRLVARSLPAASRRWTVPLLAGAIVVVGVLDQTTPAFVPPYATLGAAYARDAAYFERVEASLPKNAMVFELPYAGFPVSEPINRLAGYELLRGYLHSRTVRWSYGAMAGRSGDLWLREVTARPLEDMLDRLALVGFDGIHLDRHGYLDNGTMVIAQLTRRLHLQPIVSADERLVFFNLAEFRSELRRRYGDVRWRQRREAELRLLGLQTGR